MSTTRLKQWMAKVLYTLLFDGMIMTVHSLYSVLALNRTSVTIHRLPVVRWWAFVRFLSTFSFGIAWYSVSVCTATHHRQGFSRLTEPCAQERYSGIHMWISKRQQKYSELACLKCKEGLMKRKFISRSLDTLGTVDPSRPLSARIDLCWSFQQPSTNVNRPVDDLMRLVCDVQAWHSKFVFQLRWESGGFELKFWKSFYVTCLFSIKSRTIHWINSCATRSVSIARETLTKSRWSNGFWRSKSRIWETFSRWARRTKRML